MVNKKRENSADDVGFDRAGEPFMIGDEARARQNAIVDHPDAKPVLVVAVLNDEIGIRAYGPPAEEVADILDHIAAMYRKALVAARRNTQ